MNSILLYDPELSLAPPKFRSFRSSVNPIQTRGGRLCPSHYCQPPWIQKAIYTSELLYVFCVALFNVNSINVVKEISANDASYNRRIFHRQILFRNPMNFSSNLLYYIPISISAIRIYFVKSIFNKFSDLLINPLIY